MVVVRQPVTLTTSRCSVDSLGRSQLKVVSLHWSVCLKLLSKRLVVEILTVVQFVVVVAAAE